MYLLKKKMLMCDILNMDELQDPEMDSKKEKKWKGPIIDVNLDQE
jgi:hypothetical protein